jgi:HEAT repeat protein
MKVFWPSHINGELVPYEKTVAELSSIASGCAPQRWVAFVALARSTDPMALQFLGGLVASPDPYVRRAAVEAIGKSANGTQFAAILIASLNDTHEAVVRSAIEALASLRIPEAHTCIVANVESPNPSTRLVAVAALSALWSDNDFELLLRLSEGDTSTDVRRAAARTLRETASQSRAVTLFEIWHKASASELRTYACEIARLHHLQQFRSQLDDLKIDQNGHVRKSALLALAKFAAVRSAPTGTGDK